MCVCDFCSPPLSVGRGGGEGSDGDEAPSFTPSQDDFFHKPVKLAGVAAAGRRHPEGDENAELRQTLLSNGHALRASHSESAPLRRASD